MLWDNLIREKEPEPCDAASSTSRDNLFRTYCKVEGGARLMPTRKQSVTMVPFCSNDHSRAAMLYNLHPSAISTIYLGYPLFSQISIKKINEKQTMSKKPSSSIHDLKPAPFQSLLPFSVEFGAQITSLSKQNV